ncbi:MAG: flagellar filament capping protein FliD [Bdellovibrionales bacterium]|nr:flagellar filament capping protein FliD [Bdellovibrionales bacterium]
MINFGGIASGLPPNLVDQLIEAERIPVKTLEDRQAKSQKRLDLVNELEGKIRSMDKSLLGLASTRGFSDIKLTSGDPNIIQGVVDPAAGATGSWNIEVVQLAQRAAAITNGFPDKDRTEIGVGYFEFDTPEGKKEIYINGQNNTLEGAAEAINSSGMGVRATVLNDRKDPDRPYKLVISGVNVGGDNRIEYPTLYFLDGDQDIYFEEERAAENGVVKVDGFEFEVNDNKVEGVIPGVTLDLKQAAPGRTINVSIKEDMEVVSGKVKEFVDGVNGVLSFIQAQNKLDANSDTSSSLGGDSLLRSVENRVRRLVQGPQFGLGGGIQRLNQLGIEFSRNGVLTYDEEKFNTALLRDPVGVRNFLVGDGFDIGFIPSVKREVSTLLDGVFGPVTIRKRALQDKIRQMDDQISNKERQLEVKEKSLRQKFANLETQMSRLKSQGAAVAGLGGGGGAPGLIGG